MNPENRHAIESNLDFIVDNVKMEVLWPKLLESRIFNEDDCNIPRWEGKLKAEDVIRSIFMAITHRGPLAFSKLIRCLNDSNNVSVVEKLDIRTASLRNNNVVADRPPTDRRNLDDSGNASGDESMCSPPKDEYHKVLSKHKKPLTVRVLPATEFKDGPDHQGIERYRMRSKPRGLVLIIVNINYVSEARTAAEYDERNLIDLFEQMGFEVIKKRDLTVPEMRLAIREFSQNQKFYSVDSCFVFISCHGINEEGTERTLLKGIDYQGVHYASDSISTKEIIDMFDAYKCPWLIGKPKVFVFQSCRGEEPHCHVNAAKVNQMLNRTVADGMSTGTVTYQRHYQDILEVYATTYGNYAYRDRETGSWVITILCEVFMNHAKDRHVEDLLRMVDFRLQEHSVINIARKCQTTEVKNIGFNKHLYIHPGLYETDNGENGATSQNP